LKQIEEICQQQWPWTSTSDIGMDNNMDEQLSSMREADFCLDNYCVPGAHRSSAASLVS